MKPLQIMHNDDAVMHEVYAPIDTTLGIWGIKIYISATIKQISRMFSCPYPGDFSKLPALMEAKNTGFLSVLLTPGRQYSHTKLKLNSTMWTKRTVIWSWKCHVLCEWNIYDLNSLLWLPFFAQYKAWERLRSHEAYACPQIMQITGEIWFASALVSQFCPTRRFSITTVLKTLQAPLRNAKQASKCAYTCILICTGYSHFQAIGVGNN